jgi:hypothetical protein
MSKILFIMFQGAGTNQKAWNEYTQSKFLDRLKKLGDVYTYQDKVNNIWHYDMSDAEHIDFDSDIDFGLSYVRPDTHIQMVYDDIQSKYNIAEYKFIPVGFSAGCLFALYFAQLYSALCIHLIFLDSAVWTEYNMKLRLQQVRGSNKNKSPITDGKLKHMLDRWKINHTNRDDMYLINDVCHDIRSSFFSEHLKKKLPVPTLAFVNIQESEVDEWSKEFNNHRRMGEVKILKKHNPDNYTAIIFTNKTHYIFDMIEPAKEIIKQIKSIIPLPLRKPSSKSKSPKSKSPKSKSKSTTGGKRKRNTNKKYKKRNTNKKISKKYR